MADTTTQPTIVWYQFTLGQNQLIQTALQSNTVDYSTVQAGKYANAICVKPQFSGDASSIGKIRLWWSTTTASTNPTSTSNVDLTAAGWVYKYFVSDCNIVVSGNKTDASTAAKNAYRMLNFLSKQQNVQNVTVGKELTATQASSVVSDTNSYAWCLPTWDLNSSTTKFYCMQPVPFLSYDSNISAQESKYKEKYGKQRWAQYVLDNSTDSTVKYSTAGSILDYACGGALCSSYQCNIKQSVTANDQFPYIFFTIKAPSDAAAGQWGGWACRISYIWPYTSSTVSA